MFVHYEGLTLLSRFATKIDFFHQRRRRLIVVMFGVIFLHVLEVWLYAVCSFIVSEVANIGSIVPAPGIEMGHWAYQYIYFSAVNYTSLGYGDLLPAGALKMLATTEALNGLLLIAWSASFTYV